MTKFSGMIENLKARQEAMASEGAFSLIDVVVTVAIVVALSVGGFIAYTGIVDNAKAAATAAAADQIYTLALVEENDGGVEGGLAGAVDAYNESSDVVTVAVTGSGASLQVAAWHADAEEGSLDAINGAADDAAAVAAAVTASATDDLVVVR